MLTPCSSFCSCSACHAAKGTLQDRQSKLEGTKNRIA